MLKFNAILFLAIVLMAMVLRDSPIHRNVFAEDATQLATDQPSAIPDIIVNSLTDGTSNCPTTCTLRGAIQIAKPGNIIGFANMVQGKIVLLKTIQIEKDLTVLGPGAKVLAIDGNDKVGLFDIRSNVNISGLSFRNGNNSLAGAIVTSGGVLNITASSFSGNFSADRGGVIRNVLGTLNISSSIFSENRAYQGGGVIFSAAGNLNIINSTFVDNGTDGDGGVIRVCGITMNLLNNTFVNNTAGIFGGAIYVECDVSPDSVVRGNLFAQNSAKMDGPDIYGAIPSHGNNLISNSKGANGFIDSDLKDIDPLIDLLADNGGPTFTVSLKANSPAIGSGGNHCPATDQRGVSRKKNCDIGAYETSLQVTSTATATQ